MEIKKIINLFRKAEGYIGLNSAYANEIAGFLEEYERRAENLVNHNADLNHRLNKAEFHIEMLEKQKEAMLKELCDKEDLVREAEGRFYELEKELDTLKNATKKQPEPEWISVEDRLPEKDGYYLVANDDDRAHFTTFAAGNFIFCGVTHWMPLPEPPKPKEPTFKDVFLEKFPKAVVLEHSGVPRVCAKEVFPQLGDDESPCDMRCAVCWSRSYFEEKGDSE